MLQFMISTKNKLELGILKKAFTSMDIAVIEFKPEFKYCLKMMQYTPDIIIIEITPNKTDELQFIHTAKKRKALENIPIIGYGNRVNKQTLELYCCHGILNYFSRPLSFTNLMKSINPELKKVKKSINKLSTSINKSQDIEILLDKNTLPSKKNEIMQKHVSNVLAFPFTVSKVLKISADEKAGAAELAKVIATDSVVTTNILKISNTVFFASSSKRITSIKEAIVRIGFNETRKIALSMAVMKLVDPDNRNFGFNRVDFWYHSLICALISERIARRLNDINNDTAFLAGLLHDFGVILLDEFFPEIFTRSLEKTTNEGNLFIDNVEEILGITHNDVIKNLFTEWKIPEDIIEAILNHQLIYSKSSNEKRLSLLSCCVALGNILAKALLFGKECDQLVCPIDNSVFTRLKMMAGFNADFLAGIYLDMKMYRKSLKLEDRDCPLLQSDINRGPEKNIGIINYANDIFIPPVQYLRTEDIPVTIFKPTDEPDDAEYDIILLWADETLTPEKALPFSQKYKGKGTSLSNMQETNGSTNAPLLICLRDTSNLDAFKNLAGIKVIPQNIDLRLFDMQVTEIISKKYAMKVME